MKKVVPPAKPPGLAVDVIATSPGSPSALRTDVAGFLGRTRRGPLQGATPWRVRVQGQRGYGAVFGGPLPNAFTPYAANGYFENDGQVAHVIRLGGPASSTASAPWDLTSAMDDHKVVTGGFYYSRFQFQASSPGCWANGARVTLTYRRQGVSGTPAVDVLTQVAGELPETIRGIEPESFATQINLTSSLIRVYEAGPQRPQPAGLNRLTLVHSLTLNGGSDDRPTLQTYLDAIQCMGDEREVALLAMPDLFKDIDSPADRLGILAAAVALADQRQDRLVLVDVPPEKTASKDIIEWINDLRTACTAASSTRDQDAPRSAAVYHPYLWVPDPLGTPPDGARLLIPPSGHVAGLISRLDRQRGAYYTPANEPVLQAFDLAQGFRSSDQAVLNEAGVNLLRCFPNRGLLVWGGRTLGTEPGDQYVAHRRLLHQLVRAIRVVAEPLVFDVNGPELWLALVRAITTVLMQAYRAGALAGDTPAQAFTVQCDDQTNPPDAVDAGRVLCLVGVAPAVPMEFIRLQITLDVEGRLEVAQ
jgi:hypothetical protein